MDGCVQPVVRGERTPFDGQLLSTQKAVELGLLAENCDRRIRLEVTRTSSLSRAELVRERDLRAVDVRRLTQERDLALKNAADWESRAEQVATRPWYESPYFLVPVTVGVTLGVVFLAVKVVDASTP